MKFSFASTVLTWLRGMMLRAVGCFSLCGGLLLAACGGSGADGVSNAPAPSTPSSNVGRISWEDTTRLNNTGPVERVIKTLDTSTGALQQFVTGDFIKFGVSASRNGILAYLNEFDDSYEIRLVRPDGLLLRSFTWDENLSFAIHGARLSPSANHVAFGLNRNEGGARTDAVYVCNTQGAVVCNWYNNLLSPAWLGNERLIARTVSGDRIYAINVNTLALTTLGPPISDVGELTSTPDSSHIIFSTLSRPSRLNALNLSNNTVTTLSSAGTGQFTPWVSSDGRSLFYLERCCSAGVSSGSNALRRVPLNLNATFVAGITEHLLRDNRGEIIFSAFSFAQF